jgi:hypothetical protein
MISLLPVFAQKSLAGFSLSNPNPSLNPNPNPSLKTAKYEKSHLKLH